MSNDPLDFLDSLGDGNSPKPPPLPGRRPSKSVGRSANLIGIAVGGAVLLIATIIGVVAVQSTSDEGRIRSFFANQPGVESVGDMQNSHGWADKATLHGKLVRSYFVTVNLKNPLGGSPVQGRMIVFVTDDEITNQLTGIKEPR